MRQKFRPIFCLFMSYFLSSCDSSQEWANLAREKYSQGNTAEALYFYDKALRANPENQSANRNLGILLAESGQAPGSSSFYLERALKKDPKDPDILLYLLEIYISQDSKTNTTRILKLFSDSWDTERYTLAKFLKDCLADRKKNSAEKKRFEENRIPYANASSRRMFEKCSGLDTSK
ncbi:hypothetical protein CH373_10065 [Leptospira perolatii]|uniref:Uncharacterized protein n=1 Tax=Leptospira perolatii TaxID=2023191 RepID=A0A2M9ZMM1_9LEPT|nr:tetratricopeptide repeat protein [Leptospira perolatii]PJZ70119.1 hypothetical protein CH360_07810 [Leptospira perolatii]PJZ73308.1 hypothetical protein CH373_10065 [Leptospira perolatii]